MSIRGTTVLVAGVRRLAKTYPNARYEMVQITDEDLGIEKVCMYTRGRVIDGPGTSGCIIGQALREFYAIAQLTKLDEGDWAGDFGVDGVCDELNITVDDLRHLEWLSKVQSSQDNGYPWGRAVENATSNVGALDI